MIAHGSKDGNETAPPPHCRIKGFKSRLQIFIIQKPINNVVMQQQLNSKTDKGCTGEYPWEWP